MGWDKQPRELSHQSLSCGTGGAWRHWYRLSSPEILCFVVFNPCCNCRDCSCHSVLERTPNTRYSYLPNCVFTMSMQYNVNRCNWFALCHNLVSFVTQCGCIEIACLHCIACLSISAFFLILQSNISKHLRLAFTRQCYWAKAKICLRFTHSFTRKRWKRICKMKTFEFWDLMKTEPGKTLM